MKRKDGLPVPYIYLQHGEQRGIAMCGCILDHGIGGDPRFWQCNLHENAELLLHALKNLCLTVECESKGSPNIITAADAAYSIIEKAEKKS
jgi:hypothetical protein